MAVERIPGEKLYIDWVGEQPELLVDPETGEIQKVHQMQIFAWMRKMLSVLCQNLVCCQLRIR